MQFYSDYSSDEGEDDTEIELWNPNELIDEIMRTQDTAERAKKKKELIERFLNQQRPMLTIKMKDFLIEDGIIETLMGYTTRLDEVEHKGEDKNITEPRVRPLNPAEDEEIVRRSFNVMEIFLNPMNDLDSLLGEKLTTILKELFKVFLPNSSGNFHHFNKIMEQLLVRSPVETTTTLLKENLLWSLLDFTHESPIVDTLIDIFCCGFPRQSDTIQFYKALVDAKVFDRIGQKLFVQGSICAHCVSDWFIKLLEKLSSFEMSGILFISLCRTSNFLDGLFKAACNEGGAYPLKQRLACASVIRELLLKSGEKIFDQSEFNRPMPNMLSAVHDKLHEHAKAHVPAVCNVLIELDQKRDKSVQFSAFTVRKPFGLFRFAMTEILTDLVICSTDTLDKVPPHLWRVLGTWFLEYRHNNLYHGLFYKLIQVIVKENHLESLEALLKKNKFLTKMVEHYKSKDLSDNRGFIILIANTIRLAGDLQPSNAWLKHYLLSHEHWKEFQSLLRHDTQLQLKRYSDITADMLEDEDEEEFEEDLDIDLGSAYARSLGFEEDAPPEEAVSATPKKRRRRRRKKNKGNLSDQSSGDEKDEKKPSSSLKKEKDDDDDKPVIVGDWWKELRGELEAAEQQEKPQEDVGNQDWWKQLKEELDTQ